MHCGMRCRRYMRGKLHKTKFFKFRKLMNLKYKHGTPIIVHLNTFQGLLNELIAIGMKLDDEVHV